MIDDLVTRGVSEPYRMFTSRAEYRLTLRADNADERLTPRAIEHGIAGRLRAERFRERQSVLETARALAGGLGLTSSAAAKLGFKVNQDGQWRSALELIAMPEVGLERVRSIWPELGALPGFAIAALEADAVYAGYSQRQEADIVVLRKEEQLTLPDGLDYAAIPSLSTEMQSKLARVRPATLGQAARIDGMTPAALAVLLGHVRRRTGRKSA
jgi:tRNA uridine 5-carboxymethylaminomethyl modification enzyme